MDFSNAKKLLELCDSNGMSISEVMKQREYDEGTSSKEEIIKRKDMEELIESILDYVRADYTDYAIMINGEWGSRKDTFLE
mgnify:FL=1